MRRLELAEIHDSSWFPTFLRDLVTDALQGLWRLGNSYEPILAKLHKALLATDARDVLDLCSGGGGPWRDISRQLDHLHPVSVQVCLTDKYPNRCAFEQFLNDSGCRTHSIADPIDATCVPFNLLGFRTMFSSFHHFEPSEARQVLQNAVQAGRGIGIFEVAQRSSKTLAILCMTPLLVLGLTPGIRPFSWSRLFWTYCLPVIPFVIGFDGLVSCLRAYSEAELREMVDSLEKSSPKLEYDWELGQEINGLLTVTYLIGLPQTATHEPRPL
jgi:hypothetical protein